MPIATRTLLAICLLLPLSAWAQEPESEPGEAPNAAAEPRPPLPERSSAEAATLQLRLDGREQQTLQAGDEAFLALWLPANSGEASGAVILLPDDAENANGAAAVGPLRRKLPDAGWHSLSLSLPDPDGDPLPPRSATPADSAAQEPADDTQAAADSTPEPAAEADSEASAISSEQRRQAHSERVMARIEAAIAFAGEQQAAHIVLLGHGTGAYWAARYLHERKPDTVSNLLLLDAGLPAGFKPPLDELLMELPLAVGDFYYRDQAGTPRAALLRLQASKRAKLPDYVQVALQALPGNLALQHEQLYRRLRGWLDKHSRAGG